MENITLNELETILKGLKKQILPDIDPDLIVQRINELTSDIDIIRKEKEQFDISLKILEIINDDYANSINSKLKWKVIPNLRNSIKNKQDELLRQIIYKSEKLSKYELLLYFISYDSLDKIAELKNKSQ